MQPRLAGLAVGLAFGVVLSWSGMTSPEVIRSALLFEDSYLFLFFAWGLWTLAGVVIGVYLFLRHHEESEPASEPAPTQLRARAVSRAA